MWRGRDLPAWEAPYVLRDARLGYLKGYERALVGGALSEVLADRLRRRAPLGREVAREARGCSRKIWVEPADGWYQALPSLGVTRPRSNMLTGVLCSAYGAALLVDLSPLPSLRISPREQEDEQGL